MKAATQVLLHFLAVRCGSEGCFILSKTCDPLPVTPGSHSDLWCCARPPRAQLTQVLCWSQRGKELGGGGKSQAQATLKTTPTMISHHQSWASPSLSAAAHGRGRVPCQSPAFMRGFIFIWWSCGPLFPEWIIRICLCWALFICSAVAESIRSVLHTIFKIIRDRQHNSHSIRIQMSADGGATTHSQKQTQLIFTAEPDSLRSHYAFSSAQPAHIFSLTFFFNLAEIANLVLWTHSL